MQSLGFKCLLSRRSLSRISICTRGMSSANGGRSNDTVHIQRQALKVVAGLDGWGQLQAQDVKLTMNMNTDFRASSQTDDLKYSLNYAVISRGVHRFVEGCGRYRSLGHLAREVKKFSMNEYPGIQTIEVGAEADAAHLRCGSLGVVVNSDGHRPDEILLSGMKLLTLIGVFTFERRRKQYVDLKLSFPWPKEAGEFPDCQELLDDVVSYVERANFKTAESLAESVAHVVTLREYFQLHRGLPVKVKVIKLNAITETEGVGVSCVRSADEFTGKPPFWEDIPNDRADVFNLPVFQQPHASVSEWNRVFLAFGSNIGDRFAHIERSLRLLAEDPKVKLLRSSSLFESEPMYFKEQSPFMNGVVEVQTRYSPHELLELCKRIEYEHLKRVKEFDNGPRSIDLDILLYQNANFEHVVLNSEDLVIPHPRMLERSFVLEPLCELLAFHEVHPISAESVQSHLKELYRKGNKEDILVKLVPLPGIPSNIPTTRFLKFRREYEEDQSTSELVLRTKSNTYVMGIVNVTPDSFSDGSPMWNDVNHFLLKVQRMILDVLKLHENVIIDIGGCSTRPGSQQPSVEEELSRTIPLITAIRGCRDFSQENVIISIDTYRSAVAEKAITAGADIVNDISGGSFDTNMFKVISAYPNVGYVLSHIRGDMTTMTSLNKYDDTVGLDGVEEFIYGKKQHSERTKVIRNICRELAERYQLALASGIKRWQIILDPGIGFAKNAKQNLDIIKHTPSIKGYSCVTHGQFVNFANLPVLLGPSRKNFIGTIIQEAQVERRDFATGTIVGSCVGYDADIIRVHDVTNCSKSARLADELYRK
ncbi:AFR647Cp [Eremothecium gossypii ATCC 10895]|uniref:Folic acid synthesis protein fol1 n=1 Tax=Eremothecium gossypii (strain ATCC 10895 / CBS 109.51 / FGSC 9923 / NRRL Y-1056) TaxID=284811 RepID=Q752C8_EREGS|nr:AFR647Cp [Eremothecium gossypii ATCC 10895]AAS54019.2 AFR647Cp [Eremothecium gossypii ATCC 10895]AEY98334.1 FAFR647Cp [Eremothecium gossypii FDAG1]